MEPVNYKEITLYEEAKAGLGSLVQQTVTVFISFVVMLLVTGGAPSGFIVALSFCLGTTFVAWSEQRRITKMRVKPLSNSSEVVIKNVQRNEAYEQPISTKELIFQPTEMGEIKYADSIEELRRMNEVTQFDKVNLEEEDQDEKQLEKENLKEKYRDKKHWYIEKESLLRGSFGYTVPWTSDYGSFWSPIRGGTAEVELHHSKSGQMYVVGFVENSTLIRLLDSSGDEEITIKISWKISKSFCKVVAIPTNRIVSIDKHYRHRKDFKSKKLDDEKSWHKKDINENEQGSDQEDWDENDDYSVMIINKYK